MPTTLDEFDKKTATIRLTLFLHRNPSSNATKLIHESGAGQKAVYAAITVLEKAGWLEKKRNTKLPYNTLYSLNETGIQAATLLEALTKLLH